jgi:hypothetical protein
LELFTNNEATKEGNVVVEAPAFSLTKVWGGLTAAIGAVAAALPALLGAPQTIVVAAIAAGTVGFVAFLGLAGVDLIVRQRASEAKLRYPAGPGKGNGKVVLLPDQDHLVLQDKHSGDEYELVVAELEDEKVTLIAHRGTKALAPTFQPRT